MFMELTVVVYNVVRAVHSHARFLNHGNFNLLFDGIQLSIAWPYFIVYDKQII